MHRKSIRLLTRTSLVVALMCLGALIHIPTSPPVTAQTLVLILSLLLFGARQTCVATLLYIMIGALGLPVFSGFGGVILGVGGVIFVESLISIIPKAIEYLPSMLMGGAALVYGLNEPGDYVASIIITAAVIIISLAVSIPLFNKKQL